MTLLLKLKYHARWLLLPVLLTLAACSQERLVDTTELSRIQDRGVLRVGTMMSPVNYYLEQNQMQSGFEYELAARLAQRLDVEIEMVNVYDLRELWRLLENGDVDFLAAGLDVTDERWQRLRFTPAYHTIEQKLVYKQGLRERPRDWSQLNGHLRVVSGSSHEDMIRSIAPQYPNLDWSATHLYDADELMEHVLDEKIDYAIVDSHHLDIKRRYNPDLSIAFTIREDVPLAWAFKRTNDDSLYAAAIEFIGEQHQGGHLVKLIDRYFGHVADFNYVDTHAFLAAIDSTLPEYMDLFQEYAGDLDWRLLAALSYQESHWDPWARSPTGVRGLMMLTIPTARSLGVRSRLDAEQSIRGGAEYLARLKQRLPDRIQEPDRTWFALAAYNVGMGHLEDARILTQRHGGNPDYWIDVRENLPLLRQKQYYKTTRFGFARGDEPVRYVGNIRRYYDTLVWLDEQGRLPSAGTDSASTADGQSD